MTIKILRLSDCDNKCFCMPIMPWMLETKGYRDVAEFMASEFLVFCKTQNISISLRSDLFAYCNLFAQIVMQTRKKEAFSEIIFNPEYLASYSILCLFSQPPEFTVPLPASNLNYAEQIIWELAFENKNSQEAQLIKEYFKRETNNSIQIPVCDPKKRLFQQFIFLKNKIRKKINLSNKEYSKTRFIFFKNTKIKEIEIKVLNIFNFLNRFFFFYFRTLKF